jgi:peptide/nickel transport system permease protein
MDIAQQSSPATRPTALLTTAVRAGLLLAGFTGALLLWPSLRPAPPARGVLRFVRLETVGTVLGPSLELLLIAMVVAAVAGAAGAGIGALADRLEVREPWASGLIKLIARLAELPWIAASPFVLALSFAVLPTSPGAGVVAVFVLAGLPAALMAAAAYDRLRQGDRTGATAAALAGLGRGLVAAAGSLVLVETVLNRPGLGRLLVQSAFVRSMDPQLVVTFLVIGLVGSLLAVIGEGAPTLPPEPAPAEPPAQRVWLLTTAASLALPLLLLVISFAMAPTVPAPIDIASAGQPPSAAHPLGTDQLGRDLLTFMMAGYRTSLALAFGAAAIAVIGGGLWGVLGLWLARGRASGAILADVVVAPAWVLAVLSLIPAVVLMRLANPSTAVSVALGIALIARLALAIRDLGPADLTLSSLRRAAAGAFLMCFGVAFVAGVGVDALGLGTNPPEPSLGLLLVPALNGLFVTGAAPVRWDLLVGILAAGPCLMAGWTLLRPFRRAQAWGRLSA